MLQTPSTSDRVGLRALHLSHERVGSYPQTRHDPLDPITAGRPQEDPEFQLQVALKWFGAEGSTASSVNAIARHFGCGAGTVLLYTKRVVIALISLWKEVVPWKSKRKKREMQDRERI